MRKEVLKKRAKELRERPAPAEVRLYNLLLPLRRAGYKIYRQYPLLRKYIVDFYIPSLKLVIEIDGPTHLRLEQRLKDRRRDEELLSKGYFVIRVKNDDVYRKPERVLKYILLIVRGLIARKLLSSVNPSGVSDVLSPSSSGNSEVQ